MTDDQIKNAAISELDQVIAKLDDGDSHEARIVLAHAAENLPDHSIRSILKFMTEKIEND